MDPRHYLGKMIIVFLDSKHTRFVVGKVVSTRIVVRKKQVHIRLFVKESQKVISVSPGSTYSFKLPITDINSFSLPRKDVYMV